MVKRPIPVHEPEVVAAGARRLRCDEEKVRNTSRRFCDPVVLGVHLSSRYDRAYDYECMRRMVGGVEPEQRRYIASIYCDSQLGSCYSVELKPCDEAIAEFVVDQLDAACVALNGGHNGIYVSGNPGPSLDRDCHWAE